MEGVSLLAQNVTGEVPCRLYYYNIIKAGLSARQLAQNATCQSHDVNLPHGTLSSRVYSQKCIRHALRTSSRFSKACHERYCPDQTYGRRQDAHVADDQSDQVWRRVVEQRVVADLFGGHFQRDGDIGIKQ